MLEKAWLRFNDGVVKNCAEFDFTKNQQHHFRGFEVTHCYNVNGDESLKILKESTGEYEVINIKYDNEVDDTLLEDLNNSMKFFRNSYGGFTSWKVLQLETKHHVWNNGWFERLVRA